MSRLSGITHCIRSIYRCAKASPSWMPVMRGAASEHSRPGDKVVLSTEGKSHFEGHQDKNRTANYLNSKETMLNDLPNKMEIRQSLDDDKPQVRKQPHIQQDDDVGHFENSALELERKIEAIIKLCGRPGSELTDDSFQEATDLIAQLTKKHLDTSDLDNNANLKVETVLSVTNIYQGKADDRKEVDCIDRCLQSTRTFGLNSATIQDVKPGDFYFHERSQVGFNNMEVAGSKSQPMLGHMEFTETSHIPGVYNSMRRHQSNEAQDLKDRDEKFIPSYKPFQTIEVPITTPDSKEAPDETKDSDNLDKVKFNQPTSDLANNTAVRHKTGTTEIKTNMKDPDSKELMRRALLRALYMLQSGTGHFTAKIIITDP